MYDIFEKEIADGTDSNGLHAKLCWEKLCPVFHNWFLTHCKEQFLQNVIQSAREGTNVVGWLYQNDIDSLHVIKKRIQYFKIGSILKAVKTIKVLIECKENKKWLAM